MKIRHKVNHGWAPDRTDPEWRARVESEAERTSARVERLWERAQERLARAVRRAEEEQARSRPDRKKVERLWEAVEARRQELLDLQRSAQASPAGSQNRGKGAYRGVSTGETL